MTKAKSLAIGIYDPSKELVWCGLVKSAKAAWREFLNESNDRYVETLKSDGWAAHRLTIYRSKAALS